MNTSRRAHLLLPWAAACLLVLAGCAPTVLAQQIGGPQSVNTPGGAIYVDDGGGTDTLPVVFLHSFGGDSGHWGTQLSHVRHDRRALAIDLRGHGKSAAPRDGDYSVAAFARDVAAAVDALGLRRFVLVGHSLGGAVAISYSAAHPSRVAGLVLVGAPGRTPPEQWKPIVQAIETNYDATMKGYWEKLLAGAQPHVRTQILGQMDAVPKPAAIAIVKALFEYDPLPPLDRYPGPKLVIYTPHGDAPHDLHNLRPRLSRHSIAGTSHWPQLDRPAEFHQVLDEFLVEITKK